MTCFVFFQIQHRKGKKKMSDDDDIVTSKPATERKKIDKKNRSQKKSNSTKLGPSRAQSSYFIFSGEKRAEVKERIPDGKAPDIARELGSMWRALSESDKKKYTDQAAKDKERYTREFEAWKADNPELAK